MKKKKSKAQPDIASFVFRARSPSGEKLHQNQWNKVGFPEHEQRLWNHDMRTCRNFHCVMREKSNWEMKKHIYRKCESGNAAYSTEKRACGK
jgi:hypothetical protein